MRAIFVGRSAVDVIHTVDTFPDRNVKVTARSQELSAGGPACNAAIAFRHLGGRATLVTAVGCHVVASVILEELRRYGVKLVDLEPTSEMPPPISAIAVNREGERNIVSPGSERGSAAAAPVDESALAEAAIVLVDGHFMRECQAWAAAARARGMEVVMDGGSWKQGTEELLANVETAICSADFLPPGCGNKKEAVLEYLKARGTENAAVTDGAAPIRFISGTASGAVEVPSVEAVDTMGAGDILHGAYCYFRSAGRGFGEALHEAAKVAAHSCRFRGTREWMNHPILG